VRDLRRQTYLANAYRVLLTRARQGMVIYVPKGDDGDQTRQAHFYDGIADFLKACGISELAAEENDLVRPLSGPLEGVLLSGVVA
jgi:hypothetical protein